MTVRESTSGVTIDAAWRWTRSLGEPPYPISDGDRYAIEVLGASGTSLAADYATARYHHQTVGVGTCPGSGTQCASGVLTETENADGATPFTPPDEGCCAIDESFVPPTPVTEDGQVTGIAGGQCFHGGGADRGGCYARCVFHACFTNWRLQKDDRGCDEWRSDLREGSAEDPYCYDE